MWRVRSVRQASGTYDEQSLLVWFFLAIFGACLMLVGWLRAIL